MCFWLLGAVCWIQPYPLVLHIHGVIFRVTTMGMLVAIYSDIKALIFSFMLVIWDWNQYHVHYNQLVNNKIQVEDYNLLLRPILSLKPQTYLNYIFLLINRYFITILCFLNIETSRKKIIYFILFFIDSWNKQKSTFI